MTAIQQAMTYPLSGGTQNYSLTSGFIGAPDFWHGYIRGVQGSLVPNQYSGINIDYLVGDTGGFYMLELHQVSLPKSFFNRMIINNSLTVLSSAATFSTGGAISRWQWSTGTSIFVPGNVYPVTIA